MGDIEEAEVRDMRYWKPWQPPEVTVMRRQRSGLESVREMALRRWGRVSFVCTGKFWGEGEPTSEARGVISMVISLPFSSLREFAIAVAVFLRGEEDEKCRLHFAADRAFREGAVIDSVHLDRAGRRKSRTGGRCATAVAHTSCL